MDTGRIREEAGALLGQAEVALADGKVEEFERIIEDAKSQMEKADSIDQAASQLKVLRGDFSRPGNTVPIASRDVAVYDPNDTGAETKASYKPAAWVKGLPAMAQPVWVQEKMGVAEKQHAEFQTDTFTKWLRAPSEDVFWKTASSDEVKAMQEDTDTEGGYAIVALTSATV